ncbi:MAG TPA: oligopeptide transporter, OPT family, partial [Phycisphaerae bacterium]
MQTDQAAPGFVDDVTEHKPYIAPEARLPELSFSAVAVGAILGIIFGASSLYLVLKVGMTVSASIPIAVLSITLFRIFSRVWPFNLLFRRDATILENNIVQTTGSAGESIAFGVGVTMPAIMILGYNLELTRVMLVAILGGLLGILMMIPLRRAFIVKQHGKLTYPEGTACADVLIVGERGGTSAKTVLAGFGVAFIYQFLMDAFKLWQREPQWLLWKERSDGTVAGFRGAAVSGEIAPALLGVGYIIGTRISCIMVAGGILASWVIIPAIMLFGSGLPTAIYPAEKPISQMGLGEIWHDYVLYIGAGAVAAGGIISMLRALPLIVSSLRSGMLDMGARRGSQTTGTAALAMPRTERDLSMKVVLFGSLGLVLAIWAAPMLHMNALGAVLIVLFGFLFVTVSSRLTGEIGSSSNPISGMTVATLLMTCLIFLALGRTSAVDKLTALSIAGVVCIAASNGGTTSQDLKTGFLVGATPR